MRSLRYSVAVFGLMAVVAPGSMAADYSPKDLLKFRPTQTGVDYDTPTDAAAIEACKVELVTDVQKRTVGYACGTVKGNSSAGSLSPTAASTSTSGAITRMASRCIAKTIWTAIARSMNAAGSIAGGLGSPDPKRQDRRLEAALGRRGVQGAGSGLCR